MLPATIIIIFHLYKMIPSYRPSKDSVRDDDFDVVGSTDLGASSSFVSSLRCWALGIKTDSCIFRKNVEEEKEVEDVLDNDRQ